MPETFFGALALLLAINNLCSSERGDPLVRNGHAVGCGVVGIIGISGGVTGGTPTGSGCGTSGEVGGDTGAEFGSTGVGSG